MELIKIERQECKNSFKLFVVVLKFESNINVPVINIIRKNNIYKIGLYLLRKLTLSIR